MRFLCKSGSTLVIFLWGVLGLVFFGNAFSGKNNFVLLDNWKIFKTFKKLTGTRNFFHNGMKLLQKLFRKNQIYHISTKEPILDRLKKTLRTIDKKLIKKNHNCLLK